MTYRRVPVVSIGKDLYADTSLIIDVLQKTFFKVRKSPFDAALEGWASGVFTSSALTIIPKQAQTPEFIKDRGTVFPILKRPDLPQLRPSGIAEWRVILNTVENEFLTAKPGTFIDGDEISLADIHVAWVIRFVLIALGLGNEPGFSKGYYPRVYKWLESLPEPRMTVVDNETVIQQVLGAGYSAEPVGVDEKDPTGLKAGDDVTVENLDTEPGAHLQHGKLFGLSPAEIVLELPTGVRLHFPRKGQVLKKA